jgi:hypothetical protein
MTRRRGGGSGAPGGLPPVYEGPQVLTSLLTLAGSPHTAEEVAEAFARAQRSGEPRSSVIPTLFPAEPRFASPEAARRLYANLFGLWARVEAGLGPLDDAPEVVPESPARTELPARGTHAGPELGRDLVEAVWTHLGDLPPRDLQRFRDRYSNAQPDLVAWLEALPVPGDAAAAASDLAFEAWAMFDQAFGDRLQPVDWKDLRALEKEPPPLDIEQPALAEYVEEQLETLAAEDPAFRDEERAQVERALATAVAALGDAVQEPS